MACRYFLDGKEFDATEFRDHLKTLPVERMAKYVPAADAALKTPPSTPDRFMKDAFKNIPDITDEQAAGLLKIMQERPQDLSDALIAAMKPATLDKFLEAWKAGLVSAPGTQFANILGNVGEQIMRLGETATSAALDPLLGGPKTRLSGEARYEMAGAMKGVSKSFGRLGTDLRDVLALAPESLNISHLERAPKIGGKLGRAVRTPYRLLGAFDEFFKGVGSEAELHKQAYRAAVGDHAKAEAIIANPPKEMLAEVQKKTLERVYQDPNKFANTIIQARNNHKWLHLLAPFAQVPSNIARLTWQRSPAGFYDGFKALHEYRQAVSSGAAPETVARLKGEAVDKLARPLLGTAVIGGFYALARSGGMTGSGPTDRKDQGILRSAGWQPYSFVVPVAGGKRLYVPFNRFEPVSALLGFAADASEAKDAKTAGDMGSKALASIVQNFTSKTYLQGLADAAAAIHDPGQFASQYVSSLAGTVVPNIVAKGAQAIDPLSRSTKAESGGLLGLGEKLAKTIQSRIPGASLALAPVPRGTGEAAVRPGGTLARFLSPVLVSEDTPDADYKRYLVDIDASPTPPGRSITLPKSNGRKVQLDDKEYAVLTNAARVASGRVESIVGSETFKRMPVEEQRAYVRRIYDRYETAARSSLYASPSFRAKATEARRAVSPAAS